MAYWLGKTAGREHGLLSRCLNNVLHVIHVSRLFDLLLVLVDRMVHSLLSCIAAYCNALQPTGKCSLYHTLLVDSISDGLHCILGFIVYWAALCTAGLHGLLASFVAH